MLDRYRRLILSMMLIPMFLAPLSYAQDGDLLDDAEFGALDDIGDDLLGDATDDAADATDDIMDDLPNDTTDVTDDTMNDAVDMADDAMKDAVDPVNDNMDDTLDAVGDVAEEVVDDGLIAKNADNGNKKPSKEDVKKALIKSLGKDLAKGLALDLDEEDTIVQPTPPELDANERVRREEIFLMAEQLAMNGAEAYRENNYEEAVQKYRAAKSKLKDASKGAPRIIQRIAEIDEILYKIHNDWADALFAEAKNLTDLSKFDSAKDKLRVAAEFLPDRNASIDRKIKSIDATRAKYEYDFITSPKNVDPDRVERDEKIDVLYEQGKVLYRNKRYADARDMFEQILLKDPYEIKAIRYMRKINERLLEVANERRKAMLSERIAEVRWKWNDPVTPVLAGPTGVGPKKSIEKIDTLEKINFKLENIIIPRIEFEEATIQTVVGFLKERSKALDPEGEGVNIYLSVDAGKSTTTTPDAPVVEEDDGFGDDDDFGDDDFGDEDMGADMGEDLGGSAPSGRLITMNFDKIPLGEAIKYICDGATLKWRVEPHVVLIADVLPPDAKLETRF